MIMKLQAPKMITFWIAVILAILGFLGKLAPTLPLIGPFAFWFVLVGFVLLVLGLLVSGL
jgi:hypothetical protein